MVKVRLEAVQRLRSKGTWQQVTQRLHFIAKVFVDENYLQVKTKLGKKKQLLLSREDGFKH